MRKNNSKSAILFFITAIILSIFYIYGEKDVKKEPEPSLQPPAVSESEQPEFQDGSAWRALGEKLPVSRALAAKMLSLIYYTPEEAHQLENKVQFQDVHQDDWYYPYINAVVAKGFMAGDGRDFSPLEPLSLSEAQVLFHKINPNSKEKIQVTEENRDKPISYGVWLSLLQKALGQADSGGLKEYGIEEQEVSVFATPNNSVLLPWQMATDKGIFYFSGYAVDAYMDQQIKVLVKGGEIFALISVTNEAPIFKNAYISKSSDHSVTVYVGGAEREFAAEEPKTGIADIQIQDGNITMKYAEKRAEGPVIKKVTENGVELEGVGSLAFGPEAKLYSDIEGNVEKAVPSQLICGTNIADFYINGDKIIGAVVKKKAVPEKIRVVISKTGFDGYLQDSVALTGTGPYTVSYSEGRIEKEGGEEFKLPGKAMTGRITIQCQDAKDKIKLLSVSKSGGRNPEYYGVIEVEAKENGFIIVNEVNLEQYLYSVIPSEMPDGYGLEAAKVQAVTARSFAYNQFYANSMREYGANVDDSTMCQVYNNTGETENAIEAADSTKGLCITYKGEVINANFFSTSAGVTANSGEVWADMGKKVFPSETKPYLKAQGQFISGSYGSLYDEKNADAFFRKTDIDCFDKESGWFRWQVSMTGAEISASINQNLKAAYERNPMLVKTLQADGSYESKPIETIGDVQDIRVQRRGEGGNIMELMVKGSEGQVLLISEYTIRTVLRPVQLIEGRGPTMIKCHNGTEMSNYALMPSAFFTMDKEWNTEGRMVLVTFYGGGNGHGVGMSQNGVRGMIKAGYSFEKILEHYFQGTKVEKKY